MSADESVSNMTSNNSHDELVKKVLIGCTGSVAAIKIPTLIMSLHSHFGGKVMIRLVTTERAKHFFTAADLQSNANYEIGVYSDDEEWLAWKTKGDPVLHIDLRRWADILVIAPLDANTMAKMTHGICDNLLTCIVRAWDSSKPLLFAPAMNTLMWEHPLTSQQISVLKSFGYTEIPCVAKRLACNDVGMGAMAEVETIVKYIAEYLNLDMDGDINHRQ